MINAGKTACEMWAHDFEKRHGKVRDAIRLAAIREAEQHCDDETIESDHRAAVMARLDFHLYVAVLIHFSSGQISQQKVREVETISGMSCSRREYWTWLDRAYHFMAGACVASPAIAA